MPYQYTNISYKNLGKGIDSRSAENQIKEGYSEDVLNGDTIEGRIKKRTGYELTGGFVPLRVNSVSISGSKICYNLDSSLDLTSLRSSPIIVHGETSSTTAEFGSSVTTNYYTGYDTELQKTLIAPSGTETLESSLHNFTSSNFLVGASVATSSVNLSHSLFIPDSVEVDTTTFDTDIGYVVSEDTNILPYFLDMSTNDSFTYSASVAPVGNVATILASTHGLLSFNIIVQVYDDTVAGTNSLILPDKVEINPSGDVIITMSSAPSTVRVHLKATNNLVTGVVAANSTNSLTILNQTNPFLFFGVYLSGTTLEQVIPDSIVYDDDSNSVTVSFVNNSSDNLDFSIFYVEGTLSSFKLCVTPNVGTFTDSTPALSLYGIEPVSTSSLTNHIDSYRNAAEERMLCGLGGNLFKEVSSSESTITSPSTLYPNIRARVDGAQTLSPTFGANTDLLSRTNGWIGSTAGSTNFVEITEVAYDSGELKFTLSLPSRTYYDSDNVVVGSLGSIIVVGDQLTVTNTGFSTTNGTFTISSIDDTTPDILVIGVETTISNSDYDETDVGGRAGIFTDRITVDDSIYFLPSDRIISGALAATDLLEVVDSTTTLVVNNVVSPIALSNGTFLFGQRSTKVIGVRDDTANIVKGDLFFYTTKSHKLKVKYINPNSDLSVSISGSTVTLASTTDFSPNQSVILSKNDNAGTYVVESIDSATTMTLSGLSGTGSATLVGKTIEFDDTIQFTDTVDDSESFSTTTRWESVEQIDTTSDKIKSTRIQYFDSNNYSSQTPLRSTTVADNMYLTNGDDEVFKFDGTNLYHAGLPKHQLGLFISLDTSASAKIIIPENYSITSSTRIAGNFGHKVPIGEELAFTVGDSVKVGTDDTVITKIADNGTDGLLYYKSEVSADAVTITKKSVYQYYFRLNAVDLNDNLIGSATVGTEDFRVELSEDAAVIIRLLSPPDFGLLDYDRLDVEVYRTHAGGEVFYKHSTQTISFTNTDSYIKVVDSLPDDVLVAADPINTALKGAELGLEWEAPLRAKYITSANNRLLLGNIKDYPKMDVQLFPITNITEAALDTKSFLFKKDNTDSGTTTDMVNRVKFTFTSTSPTSHTIAAASGTFTLSSPTPTHTAKDWIYIIDPTQTFSGWHQMSGADTFEVANLTTSAPTSVDVVHLGADVPIYTGTDSNYQDVRESLTFASLFSRRFAAATNCVMVNTNRTLADQSEFKPWLRALGDGTNDNGQIFFSSIMDAPTFVEVDLPTITDVNIFVNGQKRTGSVTMPTRLYPSRVLVSYPNYPEIFDAPTSVLEQDSDSVVDVNSADGQEITGIIPFFGTSTTGAAQSTDAVIVFKTNSIYLLNVTTKQITKIDSRGLGCTAPYSIAQVPSGIIFANESGIYRLDRSFNVIYIGRDMERFWGKIDKSLISLVAGHTYPLEQLYKISVPITKSYNEEVYVYDYSEEDKGEYGSWVRYDNHVATGWANLRSDAFFGSTSKVYKVRVLGDSTDFRDDEDTITFEWVTKAFDFGDPGIRKVFRHIVTHFRTLAAEGTSLLYSINLDSEFASTNSFTITTDSDLDNLSDTINSKVTSLRHSLSNQKGIYLQLKYTNDSFEDVDIAGISFKVAGLNVKGIKEAAET